MEATTTARRVAFERRLEELVAAKANQGLSARYVRELKRVNLRLLGILMRGGKETIPERIGPPDIEYLRAQIPPHNGNYRSQQHAIQYLGVFLSFCRNNVIQEMRISWPEGVRLRTDWLTPEQLEVIHQAVSNDPELAMLFHLMADLGLRRVEVQRIRVQDFDGDVVHIIGKGRGTGKRRDLHRHPETDRVLEDYLAQRDIMVRRVLRERPGLTVPDNLILGYHMGRLAGLRSTALDRRKDRMVALSGIRFGNHTLRRTWGREMWKAGVPIETISSMMGHAETKTTLRYLGINFDDQGQALLALYQRQLQYRAANLTKTSSVPALHQNA